LSRAATVNRNIIKQLAPVRNGAGKTDDIFMPDGSDLHLYENAFSFKDGRLIPRHRSIAKGPWRNRGNCGGMSPVILPDQFLMDSAAAYYATRKIKDGLDDQGRFRAVPAMLSMGIDIAQDTLFRPQTSPVVTRYSKCVSVT
jgi:hypothetical protein